MRIFASRQEIVSEVKGLLSLGLPITVTQLLQVGYTTAAVIMTGRVGATELAAVGLGATLWIFVYLGRMGLLLALSCHRPSLRRSSFGEADSVITASNTTIWRIILTLKGTL